MIAIQLSLCMQFGTLCIQLSHLYSAPKLLEKSSFKLESQYERSVLPRIFHYGKEVGEMLSLCVHSSPLGKEVKQERNLRARKKKQNKKNEKERGEEKEEEIRKIK